MGASLVYAWSGKCEILAHGSATTFFGGPLHLSVPADPPMRVEFWFRTDASIPGPQARADWNEIGLLLDCANFDDDSGRGTQRPLYLRDEGEEQVLFLHFHVQRFGRSEDRTVFYTFFRAKRDELPPHALNWES